MKLAEVPLFAESFHDWFNRQPYAPFLVIGLLVAFGAFLLYQGWKGITKGMLVGMWGRVFTGKSARKNGYIFCGIGAVMVLYAGAALVMKLL
jgi:hypothetical protein